MTVEVSTTFMGTFASANIVASRLVLTHHQPRRCCSDVESHTRQGPTAQRNHEDDRQCTKSRLRLQISIVYPKVAHRKTYIKTYSKNKNSLRLGEL